MLKNTIFKIIILLSLIFINKIIFLLLNSAPLTVFSAQSAHAFFVGLPFNLAIVLSLVSISILIDLVFIKSKKYHTFYIKVPLFFAGLWIGMTNLIDFAYLSEAGRHITYEIFTAQGSELSLIHELFSSFFNEILISSFVYIIFIVLVLKFNFNRIKLRPLKSVLFLFAWVFILISAIRGGYSDVPQSPMTAYKAGNKSLNIAWDPSYTISYYLIKGSKKSVEKVTRNLSKKEMSHYKIKYQHQDTHLKNLVSSNIIFVLLESWPATNSFSYSQKVNATPFFDSLRKRSFTTHAMYSNGFRTVEGMFASLCSYSNPIGKGVAGTQLQTYPYNCLPNILREHGWSTAFIQGSGKGIVGAFAQSIGFEYSFGKKDYHFDAQNNYWGYMDDAIYTFSLQQIERMKQPYLIVINTGTTHDTILPKESDYKFGKDSPQNIRKSVLQYADKSLQQFITKIKKTITEPTLIVLMADHTSNMSQKGLQNVSLPFLMFTLNGPELKKNKLKQNRIATQRDIAPTILDWLGGSASWFSGHSLLKKYSQQQNVADFSIGTSYYWIQDRNVIELNATGKQVLKKCSLILDDTITLKSRNCRDKKYQLLYQQAKGYLNYSQQRLFNGESLNF